MFIRGDSDWKDSHARVQSLEFTKPVAPPGSPCRPPVYRLPTLRTCAIIMKNHTAFPALFSALCLLLTLMLAPGNVSAGTGHWVTTWATAPYLITEANLPPAPLAFHTLRQYVRTSIGGKHLRLRFCNAYGTSPVTIQSAHLALAAGAGSAGIGEIDPATDKALAFKGRLAW